MQIIDYLCVSGSYERNVLEWVDHLHDNFLYPPSINSRGYYNVRSIYFRHCYSLLLFPLLTRVSLLYTLDPAQQRRRLLYGDARGVEGDLRFPSRKILEFSRSEKSTWTCLIKQTHCKQNKLPPEASTDQRLCTNSERSYQPIRECAVVSSPGIFA